MNRGMPKSLTTVDLVVIVAALAFGVYALRWGPGEVERALGLLPTQSKWEMNFRFAPKVEPPPVFGSARLASALGYVHWGLVALPTILMPTSLALAFATFRRPRALPRRIRTGRGVVASGLAGLLVLAYLLNEGITRRFPWLLGENPPLQLATFTEYLARDVALGILAAWFVLVLGGAHRLRPDARERLGRLLGWAWVAAYLDRLVLMHVIY